MRVGGVSVVGIRLTNEETFDPLFFWNTDETCYKLAQETVVLLWLVI